MHDLGLSYSWLHSAKIDFLKGGFYDGALATELIFTGRPVDSGEAASLLSTLLSNEGKMPKDKLVRIVSAKGTYDDSNGNFTTIIKALKKYGFLVSGVVTQEIGQWADELMWVIVKTNHHLLMFQPSEVWYSPEEDENIKDIRMPFNPQQMTFLFLSKTKTVDATTEFFCRSQYHWQLI